MSKEITKNLAIIKQTILEVKHAQYSGSNWYTKGHNGLYMQVQMHLNRADDAIKEIESKLAQDETKGE